MFKKYSLTFFCGAACVALFSCSAAPSSDVIQDETGAAATLPTTSADEPNRRPDTMLRATLRLTDKGLEVIDSQVARNTVNRRDPYKKSPTYFVVLDEHGEELLRRGVALERNIRLEPNPAGDSKQGGSLPVTEPVFSLAVPLPDGADLIRLLERKPDGELVTLGEISP